jgi:hypothetical protein
MIRDKVSPGRIELDGPLLHRSKALRGNLAERLVVRPIARWSGLVTSDLTTVKRPWLGAVRPGSPAGQPNGSGRPSWLLALLSA